MDRLKKKYLPLIYGTYYNGLSLISAELAARRAFETFSKVRKGRLLKEQEAHLQDARAGQLEVAGHRIQTYHWPGDKPTVLLVHGWESNTYRWRNLIPYLQEEGYDIRAFDAPAHGASSGSHMHVLLYAECLDALVEKYQPHFLIGHSVGGMTALFSQYRSQHPHTRKIITLGSPSEFQDIMGHFQQLLRLSPRVMKALDHYVQREFGLDLDEFSSTRFVKDSAVNGLLFHDRQDVVAPFRASEQVHSHWERSTLVATEGLGHSMHQEAVQEQIVAFLADRL